MRKKEIVARLQEQEEGMALLREEFCNLRSKINDALTVYAEGPPTSLGIIGMRFNHEYEKIPLKLALQRLTEHLRVKFVYQPGQEAQTICQKIEYSKIKIGKPPKFKNTKTAKRKQS